MKLRAATKEVREGIEETLTYYAFPDKHHRQIRTNNMLERVMREIRRRTRVVGSSPDGRSALMLATIAAALRLGRSRGYAAVHGHEPAQGDARPGNGNGR